MSRTTKQHFRIFREEFLRQVQRLGLKEWRLDFVHEEDNNAYACVYAHLEARAVKVVFSTNWDDGIKLCEKQIKQRAKHEAAELLVADAEMLAGARFTDRTALSVAFHTLVRRIEILL